MANVITDGDFTTASAVSAITYESPIAGVSTPYIARQDFVILATSFSPLAIGTAHPTLADYYLQEETAPQATSVEQVVRWTRVYAKVPETHSEPGTIAYNFIGFWGIFGINVTTVDGRQRFTKTVPARVQYDYYRLDGVTYVDVTDIPIVEAQRYTYGDPSLYLDVDYLSDSPPFTDATTPTRTEYEGWVLAKTPIVAATSELDLWMGNIVRRKTIYILPQ